MSSSENHHHHLHHQSQAYHHHQGSWYGGEAHPHSHPHPHPPPYYPSPTSHTSATTGMIGNHHHSYHPHQSHHAYSQHPHPHAHPHANGNDHAHPHAPAPSHHHHHHHAYHYGGGGGGRSNSSSGGFHHSQQLHHSFSYGGPVEGETDLPDDASNAPSDGGCAHRRDSFSYYPQSSSSSSHMHHYSSSAAAAVATPLQPPPFMYNGPPVSALVPRFARNGGEQQHQDQQHQQHQQDQHFLSSDAKPSRVASSDDADGDAAGTGTCTYTPQYDAPPSAQTDNMFGSETEDHRISFLTSIPATIEGDKNRSHNEGDENGTSTTGMGMLRDDRRTSFGFPITSRFVIPTPQLKQVKSSEQGAPTTPSEDDSLCIPPPPLSTVASCSNEESPNSTSGTYTQSDNKLTVSPSTLEPTMQEASLLLGLRTDVTDTSNNSPSTVPEMQDESYVTGSVLRSIPASVSVNQIKIDVTALKEAAVLKEKQEFAQLPKTCFPVPIPKTYPRSLALPNDSIKLNALHCFIRTDLLEIFVVEPSPEHLKYRHAPSSAVGRVGLRCVHCTMARTNSLNASRDDEAPMAVFYPKSVNEIYRLVTSWQRCHVRKCKSLPPSVRAVWEELRETEKSRGKTAYWADAARQIGMVDCPSRAGGIRFDVDTIPLGEEVLTATTNDATGTPEVDENLDVTTTTAAMINSENC